MAKRIYYKSRRSGPFESIIGLVLMIGFFYLLFNLAAFVFNLLWYVSPLFVAATLFIDHKVITNYGSWIFQKLKTNPVFGLGMIALTAIGFPIVSGYLLGKALVKRRLLKVTEHFKEQTGGTDEEFTDYEEIDSEPLDLPDLNTPPKQKAENRYDELFD